MRIGIGALVGITGGPATYARELIAALAALGGHDYVVFTDRPEDFATSGVETRRVPLRHTVEQVTWDHVALPHAVADAQVALYHGTKNVLPWRLRVPGVVTVHDLAPFHCPETFAWPQRWHFRLTVPSSVRRAARVVADSVHAREDLLAEFQLPAARVVTVPLGVAPRLLVPPAPPRVAAFAAAHRLGPRVIVCAGTVQPRKRVERVVAAFSASGAAAAGWELAIAGRTRPGYQPAWLGDLPPGARFLGPLSDDDLHALYAHAAIAVSASDYEGFGLTLCEAMANGCAVIAVGVTSVPEVVGDAGLLVARSEVPLLTTAIRSLLDDPGLADDLARRAVDRAARFTWHATALGTRAVYDAVLAERRQ